MILNRTILIFNLNCFNSARNVFIKRKEEIFIVYINQNDVKGKLQRRRE